MDTVFMEKYEQHKEQVQAELSLRVLILMSGK